MQNFDQIIQDASLAFAATDDPDALEQIKADIAYSNANVKLVGISSGMAYGELGPTHHSIEDFPWTRVLPNAWRNA